MMARILPHMVWIVAFLVGINACAIFQDSEQKRRIAVCKELKHQIVWNSANGSQEMWNGATGNQMLATEQRAQTELLNQNYREEDCS